MGADALSLALIDARNRSLRWLARFEQGGQLLGDGSGAGPVALHLAGRAAWLQEWWIVRNVHRLRAEAGAAGGLRLPGVDTRFDLWFGSGARALVEGNDAPTPDDVRGYLQTTLEQTLDLLAVCPGDDEALYAYRCALQHEDRLSEAFAVAAQTLGMAPGDAAAPNGPPAARVPREPLWIPSQRLRLGSPPGGWVPPAERWAHEESVPEFEIDAQAVSWARYVEFADDGGYDRAELWHPQAWAWLQAQGRRAPRHVEQLRNGVLLARFGSVQQAPAAQAAVHISWYEADAWCRWAGRRLPTEPEWELAASTAASRGWLWGDVWEWTAGTARAWPGGPAPTSTATARRVLRGASSWTAARAVHVRQRRFVAGDRDDLFCGFRSCAP
jgi:formylglycine-generating enzyme required for sulfatase activity